MSILDFMKIIYLAIITLFLISCKESKNNSEDSTKLEDQYAIAYNVLYDAEKDDYEVFSMNLDGSNKKNISNLPGVEWTYYAQGKNLYFISDKDTAHRNYFLYKTDFAGKEPKKIFDIRLEDSWMGSRKNGAELIVKPHRSVDTAFYIIDTLGEIQAKIDPGLAYFNDPVFSPSGDRIVFRGAEKPFKKDSGYIDELYIMKSDGTDLKKLTNYPAEDTTATWYNYHAGPPRWHPTEDFISYHSMQNGKTSLFGISPEGGESRVLLTSDTLSLGWHDWSDDGKWLVTGVADKKKEQYHIQLTNWNTKESKILTDTSFQYQQAPVIIKLN